MAPLSSEGISFKWKTYGLAQAGVAITVAGQRRSGWAEPSRTGLRKWAVRRMPASATLTGHTRPATSSV
jgi:hypothetical protein